MRANFTHLVIWCLGFWFYIVHREDWETTPYCPALKHGEASAGRSERFRHEIYYQSNSMQTSVSSRHESPDIALNYPFKRNSGWSRSSALGRLLTVTPLSHDTQCQEMQCSAFPAPEASILCHGRSCGLYDIQLLMAEFMESSRCVSLSFSCTILAEIQDGLGRHRRGQKGAYRQVDSG